MSINRHYFSTDFNLTNNNRWHHIAVTWSGQNGLVRACLDGAGDCASAKAAQLRGTIRGHGVFGLNYNRDGGG